jgi:hypothetical protein
MTSSSHGGAALGRLLAHESSLSDLLAFLAELDPLPIEATLGLAGGPHRFCREASATRGMAKGRLDLVVRRCSDNHPVAVLEIKGASDVHGDQLDRYNTWSDSFDPPVRQRFYCTLDGDIPAPDPQWRTVSLVDLFGAWRRSDNAHAAWLSDQIAQMLGRWDSEADGIIGKATGRFVPDLISRRVTAQLKTALQAHADGSTANATRTSGGTPMFLAWRKHPGGSALAWIGVDVRCQSRADLTRRWLVRPFIQMWPTVDGEFDDDARFAAAQLEAHDLAIALQPAMSGTAIVAMLEGTGMPALAAAVQVNARNGLAYHADQATLSSWRDQLALGVAQKSRHPLFFDDQRQRLATQLELHTHQVTRHDLTVLVLLILDHLISSAAETS